jgi:hypothetical protein
MARRNYSEELRAAQDAGRKIVCSVQPWEGFLMEYRPRRNRDPRPWLMKGYNPDDPYYRYGGRFCHAVHGMLREHVWYAPSDVAYGQDGYTAPVLVYVSHVDENENTAQVKADHWNSVSTVKLDRLFLPKYSAGKGN